MLRPSLSTTLLATFAVASWAAPLVAQDGRGSGDGIPPGEITEPIVAASAEIDLADGPPSLPPGARFAVLEGDPAVAAPLTFRLWFPADYRIPPHYHSVIEHVTVLDGTLNIEMVETGREATYQDGVALSEGDFGALPRRMVHAAWTGDEPVLIQLHSTGPWTITYVNPEDDPRNGSGT